MRTFFLAGKLPKSLGAHCTQELGEKISSRVRRIAETE